MLYTLKNYTSTNVSNVSSFNQFEDFEISGYGFLKRITILLKVLYFFSMIYPPQDLWKNCVMRGRLPKDREDGMWTVRGQGETCRLGPGLAEMDVHRFLLI